jgi:membrane associated rhomboid family serine protease
MTFRSSNSPQDGFRALVYRGGTPFTNGLLIVCFVIVLLSFLFPLFGNAMFTATAFDPSAVAKRPWTVFTYPFAQSISILTLIFSGLWTWFVGGSLERSWGTQRYVAVFFGLAAAFAIGIGIGSAIAHTGGPTVWGLYPALAGVTVAWCTLMPEQSICVWPITLRAKYLAVVVAVVVWFEAGQYLGPLAGAFAELGPLAGYCYVRYGRSWGSISHQTQRGGRVVKLDFDRKGRPRRTHLDGSTQRSPLDFAGRYKDWQEQRRLEKLLRNSGIKNPDWIDEDRKYN